MRQLSNTSFSLERRGAEICAEVLKKDDVNLRSFQKGGTVWVTQERQLRSSRSVYLLI